MLKSESNEIFNRKEYKNESEQYLTDIFCKSNYNKFKLTNKLQIFCMRTNSHYKTVPNDSQYRGPIYPLVPPYQSYDNIIVDYTGKTTTYQQMLAEIKDNSIIKEGKQEEDKGEDNKYANTKDRMLQQIRRLNPNLLTDPIYVLFARIDSQNNHWQVWKHQSEILLFFKQIQQEIAHVQTSQKLREPHIDSSILTQFNKIQRTSIASSIHDLALLLNLIGQQPYLKKSVTYLTFVQHCLPLHLWYLKVFQQVTVYYDRSYLNKFLYQENQIERYLTVVSDGIILSTKNPMETKVDQMIPFTNQFQCASSVEKDDDIFFQISSCVHENIKVNLKKNYIAALNFYIGTKRAIRSSGYLNDQPNRFHSFSAMRLNCWTKLYNDGHEYFSDLYQELKKAKKHVCITDWWMTPYFVLKRNPNNPNFNDIQTNQTRLDKIFQKIAQRGVKVYIILFRQPLGLVCNDSQQGQNYLQSLSPNIRVRRHPIVPQYWSHHEKCVIIDQRIGFMGGLDICYGRWDNPDHHIKDFNNLWNGADYANDRLRAYAPGTTSNYHQSPLQRSSQCRMPWHDIAIMLRGDAVIDLARHFIQYWYFVDGERIKDPFAHLRNVKRRLHRTMQYQYPDWSNKLKSIQKQEGVCNKLKLCGTQTKLFFTGTQNKMRQLLVQVRSGKQRGDQALQLCRSASEWSIGARSHEQSIHQAYQALISQSEHLIYIQNQFFMGEVNKVVEFLANRIKTAHQNKQNFKVVVVMPLLPGFEGDITRRSSGPLRFQVNNQFTSINRGQKSLYYMLKDLKNFNIDDYIYFFGLRAHSILNNKPVTQIVYVHSKLMIVDDKRAIIGSANINDRSLCGNRDSELAIVIEQDNGNIFDGIPRRKSIFNLRARLFHQHFGLTQNETQNSNHPSIWAKMLNNAKSNTLIYRQIFQCYPDDTMTTSGQIQQRKIEQPSLQLYNELSKHIVAHAVDFPLKFLEDENLNYQFSDNKQGFMLDKEAFL